MTTTWQRMLVLGVLSMGLLRCTFGGSSGGGGGTTCSGFAEAEPNAECGTCVESACASQIQAASAPCSDFVTCMCATGGSADSCAAKLQEVSCQPASDAVATCAKASCSTQCAGIDASAFGDSSGSQPEGGGMDATVESAADSPLLETGPDSTLADSSSSGGDSSGSSSGGDDASETDGGMPEAAPEASVEAGLEAGTDASDAGGCTTGLTSCSGTCTDTTKDNSNCGVCGTVCGGGQTCVTSACTCPGTQTFCNGTCTDTTTDNSNCGECGTACTGGAVCVNGTCGTVCKAPTTTCSGKCTNTGIDPSNCGSCGNVCGPNQNASPGCDNGSCVYGCNFGFLDCKSTTGCEINGQIDLNNCGACGAVCGPGHDAPACAGGTCSLNCAGTFRSCDNNNANGCEDDTSGDVNNCSACGKSCPGGFLNATRSCSKSACGFTCNGTFQNCDASKTGCDSDSQTDPNNCNGCGKICPNPAPLKIQAGTTPTCSGATCGYSCNAPFADCNGSAKDGCELNTSADLQNCGACGAVCVKAQQI